MVTTNAGSSWRLLYLSIPKDTHDLIIRDWIYIKKNMIYFLADSTVLLGWDGLNQIIDYQAYIYKTYDGGINWEKIQINDKWRSRRSYTFSMADSLHGIIVQFPSKYEPSETTDQILFTDDGWKTFRKVEPHQEMKAAYHALFQLPQTIVAHTYGYEKIYITTDLGKYWIKKDIPDNIKFFDRGYDDFKFYNENTFYYIGNKLLQEKENHTVLFKTSNEGDDWIIIYDGYKTSISDISIINDSTIYLHYNTLLTTNNGRNWIIIENAYVNNLELPPFYINVFSESNKISASSILGLFWVV